MLLALASAVFSGPSPLVLASICYCLRFETSLFVASYDSQGHGGDVRHRLHRGPLISGFALSERSLILSSGIHGNCLLLALILGSVC
jgi:hypothetical protein